MTDIAGRWLRVSTGGQDEANQEPSVDGWIAAHGYATGPTYRLQKSASKGKHEKTLNEMLADMKAGTIQVLVVWYSARIERRGAYDHFVLAHMVRERGGRIEYVAEPWLNEVNAMSDAFLAMTAAANQQYTDTLSANVRIAFNRIDGNSGATRGRAVYGYHNVGDEKYKKTLEPYEPEAAIVREVFGRYLGGQSIAGICRWLNSSGHLTRAVTIKGVTKRRLWTPKTLVQVLRSPTLMGRHEQGAKTVAITPIVSVRDWKAVQAKLDSRAYRKGTRTRPDTALLTSILHCGACGRAMYRTNSNSKQNPVVYYCRPNGKGESCKMMIPLPQADELVIQILRAGRGRKITRQEVVKGHNHDDDIDRIGLDIQALNPVTTPDYRQQTEPMLAEIERLRKLPAVPDRVEAVEIDLGHLVGPWETMTDAQRREIMLEIGLKLYAVRDDERDAIELTLERPAHLAA